MNLSPKKNPQSQTPRALRTNNQPRIPISQSTTSTKPHTSQNTTLNSITQSHDTNPNPNRGLPHPPLPSNTPKNPILAQRQQPPRHPTQRKRIPPRSNPIQHHHPAPPGLHIPRNRPPLLNNRLNPTKPRLATRLRRSLPPHTHSPRHTNPRRGPRPARQIPLSGDCAVGTCARWTGCVERVYGAGPWSHWGDGLGEG